MVLTPDLSKGIKNSLKRIQRWAETRGLVWTAGAVKQHRLALTRYLAGHPLQAPAGISMTSDGLPKLISHELRELVRAGNPEGISLALTLLSVTRGILGGKPVDLAPIREPSNADLSKIRPYIKEFLNQYQIKPFDTQWTSFHWSTKMGPSGPSLVSALGVWRHLPPALKADHILIGGSKIQTLYREYEKWTTDLWTALLDIFPSPFTGIRKLSIKPDREAKSRVFAMLDYYSQTVLIPIHDNLFQGLKRIPSDRTFVQAEGLAFDPSSDVYHSLDLSSATDRFPLQLQKELLAALIGEEKADAWARILTQWPYDLKGESVLYGAGQPMGAYSSWAAFTMTHHLVVYAAARLAGKPAGWSNYALLGDDIVIADDTVAQTYKGLLRDLDVPISIEKSHASKDTYEFAKRWFHKGLEVSPFPVIGLVETVKKYYLLLEQFRQVENRRIGDQTFLSVKPRSFSRLLRIHGFQGRQISSYIRKYMIAASIPLAGSSREQVYECAKRFISYSGVSLSCNLGFASVVRIFEQFAASAATWTLAREAERILMAVTKWNDSMNDAISSLPAGPVDQAELLDVQAEVLPVLGALGDKAERCLDTIGPDSLTGVGEGTIWDKHSRMSLLQMPAVKGINPTRSSYQIAGARATWALNLVRIWKRHEQGLRP